MFVAVPHGRSTFMDLTPLPQAQHHTRFGEFLIFYSDYSRSSGLIKFDILIFKASLIH